MSWVKKGPLYGVLIVLGVFALLLKFFLDPLLKRGLVVAAQNAVRAKVDVASLRTSFWGGSLEIKGVAAANKDEPMKNLFELEAARFAFRPAAALRARAVISDASLAGLRFGTDRKTSGALARTDESSKVEEAVRRAVGPQAEQAVEKAKQVAMDPKQLKSLAGLDAAEARLKDVEKRWKDRVEKFKNVGKVDPLKAIQLAKEVEAANRELRADLAEVESAIHKAEELRKQDLQGLLAAAGVPSFDAESLTRRLLGPELADKVGKALYWAEWIKRKTAPSPAARASGRARRKGVTFEFPLPGGDPLFLLEKAQLAGEHAGMKLDGKLTNVATDGRMAHLKLEGTGGGRSLTLLGGLDPRALELDLTYRGLPLSGVKLGEGQLAAAVAAGTGKARGRLRMAESWNGEVVLDAAGVKLEPQVDMPGAAGRAASSALKAVSRFEARVGIAGKQDDLRLTISSDLGKTLASALKTAVTAEAEAAIKEQKAKLDALYQPKLKELERRQADLLKPLDDAMKKPLKGLFKR